MNVTPDLIEAVKIMLFTELKSIAERIDSGMKVTLDLKEVKRQEKLFKFFKESFDYLMNHYLYFKLPVSMFDVEQSDYLKTNYIVKTSKDKRYYFITSKA